ncbi:undecaprenyl-diphosphate phosphatase [Croceimicrobium sp.]|uniref:undecaprenyl-diphosphate phosphatase n=1 Tax=Croceimicrobium sp. TaxID=2828340 RepID=UPI003BAD4B7D
MGKLEAIVLGIIQGLTEFLPVSSSGHLELAKAIFGDTSVPEESLLFTVVVHFATALATILVFRKEVGIIFKGLFQFKKNDEFRFSLNIVISMIPAALVGVFLDEQIEALFGGQVLLVGAMLLITGVLLLFANNTKAGDGYVTSGKGLMIGIAQAIAILPGISRSGATISTALLLGVSRERAARFSFLMVVPLIVGKMAKDIMDGGLSMEEGIPVPIFLGFGAAFVTGWWACNWMIDIVKRANLNYFALYCFVIGILAIISRFIAF